MEKLKVDLDQLERTIEQYTKSINDFKEMQLKLAEAIKNLQNSGWVSGASNEYFKLYKDKWSTNMKRHIDILEYLKSCLNEAKGDYERVYNEIPNLKKGLYLN